MQEQKDRQQDHQHLQNSAGQYELNRNNQQPFIETDHSQMMHNPSYTPNNMLTPITVDSVTPTSTYTKVADAMDANNQQDDLQERLNEYAHLPNPSSDAQPMDQPEQDDRQSLISQNHQEMSANSALKNQFAPRQIVQDSVHSFE